MSVTQVEGVSEKYDALGYPVQIGNVYGYSIQKSGWVHVTVGVAVNFTDRRVSLKVLQRRTYLYGGLNDRNFNDKPVVSVSPQILFPVAV